MSNNGIMVPARSLAIFGRGEQSSPLPTASTKGRLAASLWSGRAGASTGVMTLPVADELGELAGEGRLEDGAGAVLVEAGLPDESEGTEIVKGLRMSAAASI